MMIALISLYLMYACGIFEAVKIWASIVFQKGDYKMENVGRKIIKVTRDDIFYIESEDYDIKY